MKENRPVGIQGDYLAVHKSAGWEPFARLRNVRELFCEKVSPPGPEGYSGRIPASKTAVAVELDFVEAIPRFPAAVELALRTSAR